MEDSLIALLMSESGRDLSKAVVSAAKRLYDELLGRPLRIGSQIASDTLEFWKWQNRIRIGAKAARIMEEEKIATRILPPNFLLPLFNTIADVEDKTLEELWAKLIASACENDIGQHPAFIDTLRQITPDEAKMLTAFYDQNRVATLFVGLTNPIAIWEPSASIAERVGASIYSAYTSNLDRLGLVSFEGMFDVSFDNDYEQMKRIHQELLFKLAPFTDIPDYIPNDCCSYVELTPFGQLFLRACARPKVKQRKSNSTGFA